MPDYSENQLSLGSSAEEPLGPTPAAEANDNPVFAELMAQARQAKAARLGQLTLAVKVQPEAYGAKRRVAQYLGYPTAVVEALPELEEQAKIQKIEEATNGAPVLKRAYSREDFAKLAHDDVENMGALERTFTGTLGDIGVTALKGAVGLPQSFVGLANIPTFGRAGRVVETVGIQFNEAQRILDTWYSPAQQRANRAVQEADGLVDTMGAMLQNPSTIATAVGESAPQMIGGAALGRGAMALAPRVIPWLAPKLMPWMAAALGEGLMAAGSSAEQIRSETDDGLLSAKQVFASVATGAGTTLFGAAGGKLANRLGLADLDTALVAKGISEANAKLLKKGFVSSLLKAGVSEGVFEEMPQSVQEQIWQNWATDKPLGEGVGSAAAQGIVTGFAMGGGFQAAAGVANRYDRKAQQADSDAQFFENVNKASTASALAARSPEDFAAFAQEVADANDKSTFYIDANALMQSGVAEQAAALSPAVAEQLETAAQTGDLIAIPAGEYAATLARSEIAPQLTEHVKTDPDAWSQAEAAAWHASGEGVAVQEEMDRLLSERANDDTFRASAKAVSDAVRQEMETAEHLSPQQRDVNAALFSRGISVVAAKMGMMPEDVFNQRRMRTANAETLDGDYQQGAEGQFTPTERAMSKWSQSLARTPLSAPSAKATLQTPTVLRAMGVKEANLAASVSMIQKVMQKHPDVPLSVLENLPALLADPEYIYPHKDGGVTVVLSAKTEKGEPIVVGVRDGRIRTLTPSSDSEGPGSGAARVMRAFGAALARDPKVYARNNEGPSAERPSAGGAYRGNSVGQVSTRRATVITRARLVKNHGEDFYQGATENPTFRAPEVRDADGNLLAPNGKPSNLNERQWHQVRSPEFKNWFGDWENDPRSASKVVDANGEPMVVYHGTREDFSAFDRSRLGENSEAHAAGGEPGWVQTAYTGFWFSSREDIADFIDAPNSVDAYLSIQNPKQFDSLEELAREAGVLGGAKYSELLEQEGYDGIVLLRDEEMGGVSHVAFHPAQIKSATGNQGTFDPNDPNILHQGASDVRGAFSLDSNTITFLQNADESTFIHEAGHYFLELYVDMAAQLQEKAALGAEALTSGEQGLLDDVNALFQWMGVESLDAWNGMDIEARRPHHEKLAQGFEKYFLEGKAPTPELQGFFRQMAAWLKNVYRDLMDLKVDLSDEVRGVFDRMLASTEEITRTEQARSMQPIFEDAQGAGMTPQEYATYQEMALTATQAATEQLQAKWMKDLKWVRTARGKALRALQKDARAVRDSVREEVRAEVMQQPVYRAWAFLTGKLPKAGTASDGPVTAGRLDAQTLADWGLTEEQRAELVRRKMVRKDGLHPDIVADLIGDEKGNPLFDSGDALVRALVEAPDPRTVIEDMTDARMLAEHSEIATPQALEQAADAAVYSEMRARVLAMEANALAKAVGGKRLFLDAAIEYARNTIGRTPLKALRPHQHMNSAERAGRNAQLAHKKGDTAAAAQHKRQQVLQHELARAALAAREEVDKMRKRWSDFARRSDKRLKGYDIDLANVIRAVLGQYGIAQATGEKAATYLEKIKAYDPDLYAVVSELYADATTNAKPYNDLTVNEARELNDMLDAILYKAKRSRQMEIGGKLINLEDAVSELNARMQEIGVPQTMPGDKGALTPMDTAKRALQHAGAIMRRVESWAEGMDGKYGGPFLRMVFQPVKDAADRYRADRVTYRKRYQELVNQVAPFMSKGKIVAGELGYTFGNGHNGIGMAELLHAVLHTGNDSNKRKLLLGRGWATQNADGTIDTARWDAFVQRMHDEKVLTQAHYDFAQGVWDLLEETKPLAQRAYREVFGRYFEEVTANSFETPFGTYRGGYVPAQADPRLEQDAELRKMAEVENEGMAYAFPTTNKGFTHSRVEYNRKLILDLRSIGQHIDKVLLFSHMEPAVRDVSRLLRDKSVAGNLGRIAPAAYAGMLTPWLQRSARQIVETPTVGDGGISRVASVARQHAGMALMFANASNALQQVTGFFSAKAKLRQDGLQSHMMRSTAQFIANPREMARNVASASAFMDNRMAGEISALNDAMNDILLDPGLYRKAQAWSRRHAYFMQTAFANTMEPIIWTAGYNAALEKGMSDQDAVRYADGLIRQTQGSTLPEDVSRSETGNAVMRLFNQFVGYWVMMANTNATGLKQIASDVGLKKGAGKAFMLVTQGMLIPIWVAEAIAIAMRGGPEDEDDDGYLDDWLAQVFGFGTIKGVLAMVPVVGQSANAAINRLNGNPMDDRVSMSPVVSLLETSTAVPALLYKAATDPESVSKRKAVRDVSSAISLATGLPAYAVARPLGYAAGVADDDIDPTGPVDAVRGVVTGTASPESR
ncbi:MAG: hypothetical protein ACK5NE_09460 [Brachymonas sp.]